MHIYYLLLIVQLPFLARFFLEFSFVNAHIEPIKTLRKITNLLVLPVKKMIPFPGAKKYAALIVAFLFALLLPVIAPPAGANIFSLFFYGLTFFVRTLMMFLQHGVFLYVMASWVRIPALQKTNYLLHHIFEPVLRPIKKVVPPIGMFDVSPLFLLFGLSFLSQILF